MLELEPVDIAAPLLTPPTVPRIKPIARPEPRFRERPLDAAVAARAAAEGYTELQAALIARRVSMAVIDAAGGVRRAIAPHLHERDSTEGMPDLHVAAARIVRAIQDGEVIGILCDHDVDGVSSCALIWCALVRHFGVSARNVVPMTTMRLVEGYGLSQAFCERVLNSPMRPTVLITADQGTSDAPRIAWLAAQSIDVVVSDHHGVPDEGPPAAAFATVNPVRADSTFDPTVCGCYVAWIVMQEVDKQLKEAGLLPANAPSLEELSDLVAFATMADAVSLSSKNNRAVVLAGLKRMREQPRLCWQALTVLATPTETNRLPIDSQTLSWVFGPMVNARGRLDEAMAGVQCLLASKPEAATEYGRMLHDANHERKGIERSLTDQAMTIAASHVAAHRAGLVIWLENGNAGISGILASRIVEAFGRPVICLSPRRNEPGVVTGSARSIDGLNLRDCFREIDQTAPGCLTKWGGHHAAAGVGLDQASIPALIDAFDRAVRARVLIEDLVPTIWHDGDFPHLTMDALAQIENLDPFGRGFPSAVFVGHCTVAESRWMGDGTHMRLTLRTREGHTLRAVWFGARSLAEAKEAPEAPWRMPGLVEVAASPSRNRYNGSDSAQWIVRHVRRTL